MKILITGHFGFIGSVCWNRLAQKGHLLLGVDNLSREIPISPADRIISRDGCVSVVGSITDNNFIQTVSDFRPDAIIHLAAQVSVVDGEKNPFYDFYTNSFGTFGIVQLAKHFNSKLIYASSNKVFGDLVGHTKPITDSQPLRPKTNYGVSKCCGAHCVADYSNGWVFHQSCIYGESQIGSVAQGWVGWLRHSIKNNIKIVCYGDGSQIRDLLHVDDLVDLYEMVLDDKINVGSYVVGGGKRNAYSFSEVVSLLRSKIDEFSDWRMHDQKYFVSANDGLKKQGWKPQRIFRKIVKSW